MYSLWNKMMKDHFDYRPRYTLIRAIMESKRPEKGSTRVKMVEQEEVCVYPDPDDGKSHTWQKVVEEKDGSS